VLIDLCEPYALRAPALLTQHAAMGKGAASQLVAAAGQAQDGVADQPIAYVNGKRHILPAGRAEATLLQWLRGEISLSAAVFRMCSWCPTASLRGRRQPDLRRRLLRLWWRRTELGAVQGSCSHHLCQNFDITRLLCSWSLRRTRPSSVLCIP
jgi:hypothetical protein